MILLTMRLSYEIGSHLGREIMKTWSLLPDEWLCQQRGNPRVENRVLLEWMKTVQAKLEKEWVKEDARKLGWSKKVAKEKSKKAAKLESKKGCKKA